MELAHEIRGSGPTLVLVHGVVHRQHAWAPVIDLLTDYRTVVTVDLPGHGDSPAMPDGPDPIAIGTEMMLDFLAELSPDETVHIAGNSLGGWFALEAAARGAVASATGLSPAGFFRGKWDQERTVRTFTALRSATRMLGTAREPLLRNRIGKSIGMGVFLSKPWRVPTDTVLADAASLLDNEVIDRALDADFAFHTPVDTSVPVTVAWGRRDLILPPYQAKKVRETFPQARVNVYPGLGHVPMWDDPQMVAAILLAGSSAPTGPRTAARSA